MDNSSRTRGHSIHEVKRMNWRPQQGMYRRIYAEGFSAYSLSLRDLSAAFIRSDRVVRCIDEGTPGGIRLAGQGILLGLDKTVDVLRDAEVEGVTAHQGCGACGIYAKNAGLECNITDKYGVEWSKKLAEALDVHYKGLILGKNMLRPKGRHIARITYYDGSGRFDCAKSRGLPPGFVISRRYLEKHYEYARQEIEISISIAMGPHGFGEMLTKEDPYMVVAIGDPQDDTFSVEKLRGEIEHLADKYGGRVKVDGFIAPTPGEDKTA
ncbi:MAG: hypothetical protein V1875_02480 [Candidatus Altiarchaeota archaeon]